jgi:Holliday junction resolvase RusA-like endonuclease
MTRMSRTAERRAWTEFVEAAENATGKTARRVTEISFSVECEPIPQGSMGGICTTKPNGSPMTVLKADNPRTHAYRRQIGFAALEARAAAGIHEVFAAAAVPVRVALTFVFERPKSAPASRTRPTVKPDYDKLARSTTDAMTGILWVDDAQVVDAELHKIYGAPAHVQITVELLEEK